jgi:hypothetical protein
MKKGSCFIITSLICLVLLLVTSCSNSDDPPKGGEPGATKLSFRKFPYLLYPSNNTSMTIAWQLHSDADETCSVQWRMADVTPEDNWQGPVDSIKINDDYLYAYTITGLDPDTIYDYEIIGSGAGWIGTFRTAPPYDATDLTFWGIGDSRQPLDRGNPDGWRRVTTYLAQDMAQDLQARQTIVLHSGDLAYYGLHEGSWDGDYFCGYMNHDYPEIRGLLSTIPVMAAIGNHECYKYGSTTVNHEIGGELFRKYYPFGYYQASSRNYYSFDYGPIHVSVLDQYTTGGYQKNSVQYNWLVEDISNSMKPWKILMFHEPAYTAGSTTADAQTLMGDLVAEGINDLKLVIQGHRHYYSRCYDGTTDITYLTLGCAGAELSSPNKDCDSDGFAKKVLHFARFTITGDTMRVVVFDANNYVEADPKPVEIFEISLSE